MYIQCTCILLHIHVIEHIYPVCSAYCSVCIVCIHVHVYQVSVNLFIQVYEMFDLDPANWATLVAQLVRASIQSA